MVKRHGFGCDATMTAAACKMHRFLFAGMKVYRSHIMTDMNGLGAHAFAKTDSRLSVLKIAFKRLGTDVFYLLMRLVSS